MKINFKTRQKIKKRLRAFFLPLVIARKKILHSINQNYIVSYPKSGRTWVNYFLATYYCKKFELSFRLNFLVLLKGGSKVPRFHLTHANYFAGDIECVREYAKSLKGKRVLLLVRDPLDVVVSLYHHTQKRQIVLDSRGLSFSEFIRHPRLGISRIVNFMNLWLSYEKTFKDFQIVRYEDLRHDTEVWFKIILDFLSLDIVDGKIFSTTIHECSFEVMKDKERRGLIDSPKLQTLDAKDEDAFKVRKGVVGAYRSYFTNADDCTYARECLRDLDSEFGYQYNDLSN